jgi:hypothetical protein
MALRRPNRLTLIVSLCIASVLSAIVGGSFLFAQQPVKIPPVSAFNPTDRDGRQVTLFNQLRVGLKAKTDDDIAFISLVVQKVDSGALPRKMVDATFLWARNRYKLRPSNHQLRPIVYFKPGLQAQAKKIGVVL